MTPPHRLCRFMDRASVVTLVLTGRSDWFEAHASGVVVTEGIGMWPDAAGTGTSFLRRSIPRSDEWARADAPRDIAPSLVKLEAFQKALYGPRSDDVS